MAGESSDTTYGNCDGKDVKNIHRKVGLIYDEKMCKHATPDGDDHPECPDRIRVIWKKLQLAGVAQRCVVLGSRKVEEKHLQLVHTMDHIQLVKSISSKPKDARRKKMASKLNSIYLNGGSSEAAYLAAGSVVEVAKKVAEGELDSGFAIVRPPGHHAEADEAMGFCLFNNVAIAASYILNEREDLGVNKILIVDWDVHHGNGTQKMFWKDPRVLFFSIHRHDSGDFYPAGDDGDYNMVGEGLGEGFNINVPWDQAGCGDADYLAAWDHILIPVAKEFKPDIVLVSAGFDAALGDPLGGCCVTPYGYSRMLKKLMDFGNGKIVLALEGGYNLESISKSSLACVQVLLDGKPIQGSSEAYPLESTWRVIQVVRKRLCKYWPSLADELSWNLINQKTSTPTILISSSESKTEDDAHGILDKMSLNIVNPQDTLLEKHHIDTASNKLGSGPSLLPLARCAKRKQAQSPAATAFPVPKRSKIMVPSISSRSHLVGGGLAQAHGIGISQRERPKLVNHCTSHVQMEQTFKQTLEQIQRERPKQVDHYTSRVQMEQTLKQTLKQTLEQIQKTIDLLRVTRCYIIE